MRAYVIDMQRYIINKTAAEAAERVPSFSSCFVTSSCHAGFISFISFSMQRLRGTLIVRVYLSVIVLLCVTLTPDAGARDLPDPDRLVYPPLHFSPPKPRHFRLENGLRVYLLENRELPVVQVTLFVKSGAVYDEAGKEGTGELTTALMRSGGTEKLDPRSLDETLAALAATIEPVAGLEQVQWSLFSLRADFDRVWDIFAQIIMSPRFDPERLRLLKELKSEEIRRLADEPKAWAFKEFFRLIYQGNPRGRLPTVTGLKKIARADLVSCHRRYYTPDRMILAVSGDIGQEELTVMVRKTFGFLPAGNSAPEAPPPLSPFRSGKYYLVKDTPQTVTVIGCPAPAKGSPDYFAFDVIDHVLGSGGFRSRIFQEVRTDRGLAYATGSFYRARNDYGIFGAYAVTKTDNAGEALSIIQALVRQANRQGILPEDLERTRNSILNRFIFSFAAPHQLVYRQASLALENLPGDFIWKYREEIGRLTNGEINRTAAAWLDFDRSLILMLGTASGFDKIKQTHPDFQMIEVNYD